VQFVEETGVGPRTSEAVVGSPAEQQRVGGGQLAIDGRAHLVVEVREVAILRILHDASDMNRPAVILRIELLLIT
jgi:hypothetical protein